MEEYFIAYINNLQKQWPDWLPLVEFTSNNTMLKTTKVSSFFANKRFYSCIDFKPAKPPLNNIKEVNTDIFAM